MTVSKQKNVRGGLDGRNAGSYSLTKGDCL